VFYIYMYMFFVCVRKPVFSISKTNTRTPRDRMVLENVFAIVYDVSDKPIGRQEKSISIDSENKTLEFIRTVRVIRVRAYKRYGVINGTVSADCTE